MISIYLTHWRRALPELVYSVAFTPIEDDSLAAHPLSQVGPVGRDGAIRYRALYPNLPDAIAAVNSFIAPAEIETRTRSDGSVYHVILVPRDAPVPLYQRERQVGEIQSWQWALNGNDLHAVVELIEAEAAPRFVVRTQTNDDDARIVHEGTENHFATNEWADAVRYALDRAAYLSGLAGKRPPLALEAMAEAWGVDWLRAATLGLTVASKRERAA